MEIWKTIEGYPDYMISNMGRVKSINYRHTGKEKIMKYDFSCGYPFVNLFQDKKRKKYYIHRLVASAFLPNPDNLPQVNHKDEDKTNNNVNNLEWCSPKYNMNYGTHNERVAKANSIPILQFSKTGEFIKKWNGVREVERELGIKHNNISSCCKGQRKTAYGYKWHYHYKSLWLKKHIPQIKLKKVA